MGANPCSNLDYLIHTLPPPHNICPRRRNPQLFLFMIIYLKQHPQSPGCFPDIQERVFHALSRSQSAWTTARNTQMLESALSCRAPEIQPKKKCSNSLEVRGPMIPLFMTSAVHNCAWPLGKSHPDIISYLPCCTDWRHKNAVGN